ncbi:hypothetical protein ACQ4M4_06670 [Leptolyngbya sp. AN02str]
MLCKLYWRYLRSTYPWIPLLLCVYDLAVCSVCAGDVSHVDRVRVRFWRLWMRVDFASLLAIALELAQPEFWV